MSEQKHTAKAQARVGEWILLANEFASVHLIIDELANGPRLVIFDPASGRQLSLDPLELQTLAWSRHDQLTKLLDPAFKEQYLYRMEMSELGPDGRPLDKALADVEFEED